MAIEKTEAIVLRRTEYSNTSLILSLYTEHTGRIEVIAKGARRQTSSYHGVLDLGNRIEAVFYRHSQGPIHTLSEGTLLDDFYGLRSELFRFYAASNVLELMLSLTPSEDPNRDLYELVVEALDSLSEGPDPAKSLLIFHTDLLRILGYLPVLFECVACGSNVLEDRKAFFSPLRGGALCGKCSSKAEGSFPAEGAILRKLHDLAELSPGQAESAAITEGEYKRLTRMLIKYFTHILERELRTARFLLVT
jgi:DNA repair protein RecO (recombination protein O)